MSLDLTFVRYLLLEDDGRVVLLLLYEMIPALLEVAGVGTVGILILLVLAHVFMDVLLEQRRLLLVFPQHVL